MAEQNQATRRGFLSSGVKWAFGVVALPALYAVARFLIPPKLQETLVELIRVGKVEDIPVDTAKIVRFNKTPIVLVHTAEGQMKAFSAVCTHLGCIVEYRPDERGMTTAAEAGSTWMEERGRLTPKPLRTYRVEVKSGEIIVHKV
jgi:cytochrome b6-f complex iron-sulfur subunit